jgi:hypothetical protein
LALTTSCPGEDAAVPPYEFLADRAVSVVADGRQVLAARRLPSMLRALPPVLGPERIAALADQPRVRFDAAA